MLIPTLLIDLKDLGRGPFFSGVIFIFQSFISFTVCVINLNPKSFLNRFKYCLLYSSKFTSVV